MIGVDGVKPVDYNKAFTDLEDHIFNYITNNLSDQKFNLNDLQNKKLKHYIHSIFNFVDVDSLDSKIKVSEDDECQVNEECFDDYCAKLLSNVGFGKSKKELIKSVLDFNVKDNNHSICKSTVRGKIDYLLENEFITQDNSELYVVTPKGANELAVYAFKGFYDLDGIKTLLMNYATNINLGVTKKVLETFENYGFISLSKLTPLGDLLLK